MKSETVRRRRSRSRHAVVAAEHLEERVLLTAGDLLWNLPYDFDLNDNDHLNDVATQADGKTIAVGYVQNAGSNDFFVARLNADGIYDGTFGDNGHVVIHFAGRTSAATSVVIRPDGKIVVGGTTTETVADSVADFGLVQLNADGSLDQSFGTAGRVIWNSPGSSEATVIGRIALSPDGRIVGVGYYFTNVAEVGFVLRYTADGDPDATFDGDGIKVLEGYASDVAVDPSGRTVVMTAVDRIYRLTASGAFDTSFSGDGLQFVSFEAGVDPLLRALDITPDGRLVVAGNSDVGGVGQPGVVRLLANGLYDTSFHGNGRVSFDITPGVDDLLSDLAVRSDGSIVVAGRNGSANRDWIVAQLTASGQFDTAFSMDGKRTVGPGGDDFLGGVAILPDGDVVLAGWSDYGPGIDDSSAIARIDDLPIAEDLVAYHAGGWYVGRSTGWSFDTSLWAGWANVGWEALHHGDFNGDGRSDVLGLLNGQWWVGIAQEAGFATSLFASWADVDWQDITVADLNNDGRDDILARIGGDWWAANSLSTQFAPATLRAAWANIDWHDVAATDLNGDGVADLLARTGGQWWVATGNGVAFVNAALWDNWANVAWTARLTIDANGDGLTDVVGLIDGQWWVGISNGSGFVTSLWATWSDVNWQDIRIGDFNGDGRDDVLARYDGQWWGGTSQNGQFVGNLFDIWANTGWQDVRVGDFNGDGRDDLAGRSGGQWWVGRSNGSTFSTNLWATWANVAWQAVAAAEVSRNSSPPAVAAVAVLGADVPLPTDFDDEQDPFWSVFDEEEELAAGLLTAS